MEHRNVKQAAQDPYLPITHHGPVYLDVTQRLLTTVTWISVWLPVPTTPMLITILRRVFLSALTLLHLSLMLTQHLKNVWLSVRSTIMQTREQVSEYVSKCALRDGMRMIRLKSVWSSAHYPIRPMERMSRTDVCRFVPMVPLVRIPPEYVETSARHLVLLIQVSMFVWWLVLQCPTSTEIHSRTLASWNAQSIKIPLLIIRLDSVCPTVQQATRPLLILWLNDVSRPAQFLQLPMPTMRLDHVWVSMTVVTTAHTNHTLTTQL